MKMMLLLIIGLLSVSASADENTLEMRVKDWVKSYNSNDLATMTEFYEDSDKLDILVSVGMWNDGLNAYKKLLKRDLEAVRFYDSNFEKLRVREMGQFGVVGFIHKFKFNVLQEGEHVQVHIRTTMTLRKIDGVWKIIQEHSSPIFGIERHTKIAAHKE